MAPRAKVFSRNPVAEIRQPDLTVETLAETHETIRAIPFELSELVAPYKGRGRISLRVERLPHRARLSAGRNNGDRSWSLTLDELDGLDFLTPCDADDVRSLAVRIVSVDGAEGATIAVLDCPIGAEPERRAQSRRGSDLAAVQEVTELRGEVLRVKSLLVDREAELAAERAKSHKPDETEMKRLLAAELIDVRRGYEREREIERAAAGKEAEILLETSRKAWIKEQDSRIGKLEAQAEERFSRAKKSWQQESDVALARAEQSWKTGETARMEAATANWRAQSARIVAEARNESASSRQSKNEAELRKLRDALAVATASVAERDTALAAAKAAAASDRERTRMEMASGLAEAQNNWRNDEARRMAAAELVWRKQSAEREASVRAELTAAREGNTRTHVVLEEELGRLRALLAERDMALSELRVSTSESDRQVRESAVLALGEAEKAWKEAEAHRLAAAETSWREQMAEAVSAASAELASLRAEQNAALSFVRAEGAKLQDMLGERDRELARLRATDKDPGLSRKEWEAKLADAKRSWQEGEAVRLAAAEERGRVEAETQLAGASERLARAEVEMAQQRAQSDAKNRATEFELVRARRELEKTRVVLASREVDLSLARSAHDKSRGTWSDERHVTLHEPVQAWRDRTADNENEARTTGTLIRDIALVASFAAVATLFLPRLEELLPPGTLPFTFEEASAAAPQKPATPPPSSVIPPAPIAPRPTDVILRTANLRSAPSKSSTVVASLAPGAEITPIDRRGHWILVETGTRDAAHKMQQGWVFSTYLKDGSADSP
jgi:hypothetical protein